MLGIGVNVAVRLEDLPEELRETAATLGLEPGDVEPVLERLLAALERALALDTAALLEAWRARDALLGRGSLGRRPRRGRGHRRRGAARRRAPGGGRTALTPARSTCCASCPARGLSERG